MTNIFKLLFTYCFYLCLTGVAPAVNLHQILSTSTIVSIHVKGGRDSLRLFGYPVAVTTSPMHSTLHR